MKGVTAVLSVLDKVEQIARDTPPVDNSGSRFGNPAFRTFYDKVEEVRSVVAYVILFKCTR
jgi:serine/threonine-protein phosphatase 2A activator